MADEDYKIRLKKIAPWHVGQTWTGYDMCCYCLDKATHEVYNKQQSRPEYFAAFCKKHAEGEVIRLNTHVS